MIDGKVERISGSDPYSISVNFAKYQSPTDNFGWKHNKKDGWAFTYGEPGKWYNIISAALLAHLGKHTPLLLTGRYNLPAIVGDYVVSVNPDKPIPAIPPHMHGYVLGGFNDISLNAQVEIEKVTDIKGKM